MYMQVKHRLARFRADVQNCPVTVFNFSFPRNLCGSQVTAADDLGIFMRRILQINDMFLGNDQDVGGRFRIDVLEGVCVLVFIDFLRMNLAGNDFAKKAVIHK